MNPDFKATQTSPILEMLTAQQSVFSHSPSFKAVDRLDEYDNFANAQKAFLEAFYPIDQVVFDKNRMWPLHFMKLDEILDNGDSRIIWTYRNVKHVLASMENRHREYPLIQFVEEQQTPMNTIEQRINAWCGDSGIVALPTFALNNAIEEGYGDRIFILDYKELCTNTQVVMNQIHKFLGIDKYKYDQNNFKDLKQTTREHDNLYNYKYPHNIVEGKILYKTPIEDLPKRLHPLIDDRFKWLDEHCEAELKKRNKKPGRAKKPIKL